MRIHKVDVDAGTVLLELDRPVIGQISKLMHDNQYTGSVYAHFFLLYELLQHKAFDSFALVQGNDILTGKQDNKEGEA